MRGRLLLTEAARALSPLQQGFFDNLCGLYAIINALRLLLHSHGPLSRSDAAALFDAGILYLDRTEHLPTILETGMSPDTWHALCDHLLGELALHHGLLVTRTHIIPEADWFDIQRALRWVKHSVGAGRPALVALWGMHDHYTVVARYSAPRLTLFDSQGLRWIQIASLGAAGAGEKRHLLCSSSAIELRLIR